MSVETQAVIHGVRSDTRLRRNGGETEVWLRPGDLDGEGEVLLSVADLGDALTMLGFERFDVFPRGAA